MKIEFSYDDYATTIKEQVIHLAETTTVKGSIKLLIKMEMDNGNLIPLFLVVSYPADDSGSEIKRFRTDVGAAINYYNDQANQL